MSLLKYVVRITACMIEIMGKNDLRQILQSQIWLAAIIYFCFMFEIMMANKGSCNVRD
jgi:hypothetical protein